MNVTYGLFRGDERNDIIIGTGQNLWIIERGRRLFFSKKKEGRKLFSAIF